MPFFPKSVLGNLDPYSGTWTRTWELPVLVYVFKSPSTGHTRKHPIFRVFCNKCLNSYFYTNHWCLAILPCPMGHRIRIWAQKDWFFPEILGREVGPISVTHTVYFFCTQIGSWRLLLHHFVFVCYFCKIQTEKWLNFLDM